MHIHRSLFPLLRHRNGLLALILLLPFLVQGLACSVPSLASGTPTQDTAATIAALNATITAQAATPTQAPAPTQPPAMPTSPPGPPATPIPPAATPPPTPNSADFSAWATNASILLFEDIAGNPEVFRYVIPALERLGLKNIDDVGDAQGRLKERMLGGAPGGKPWDLVIIAAEDRSGVQGEFFDYLESILGQGSAVILEAWYLDEVSEGAVKPILMRCGVGAYNWFGGSRDSSALKLWALQPDHPLLNNPLVVKDFRIADYWPYEDQGDLMYLTGTGDAQFVIGSIANVQNDGGVLTTCLGGQLIIQTFSSHNYLDETSVQLWANYISYALSWRYNHR
jgi:hypothetical protein